MKKLYMNLSKMLKGVLVVLLLTSVNSTLPIEYKTFKSSVYVAAKCVASAAITGLISIPFFLIHPPKIDSKNILRTLPWVRLAGITVISGICNTAFFKYLSRKSKKDELILAQQVKPQQGDRQEDEEEEDYVTTDQMREAFDHTMRTLTTRLTGLVENGISSEKVQRDQVIRRTNDRIDALRDVVLSLNRQLPQDKCLDLGRLASF